MTNSIQVKIIQLHCCARTRSSTSGYKSGGLRVDIKEWSIVNSEFI